MSRMLDAFQTLAGLTADPHRRRALREQVQWIAELAKRTLKSLHDRKNFEIRLARLREALDAESTQCPGAEKDWCIVSKVL